MNDKVIGLHRGYIKRKVFNIGTFLKFPLNELNKNLNKKNAGGFIIAEIYIKEEDINKNIRIINSYEECMRSQDWEIEDEYKNEDEIKKCEIKINNELIPFNYFYKFKFSGNLRLNILLKII